MNQAFFSFLTGLLYTSGLFFTCLFVVIGAKAFFSSVFIKNRREKRSKKPQTEAPKPQEKTMASAPKPIKSIEINPDEIERIYVKKSS